ncbi:MAG: flagellar biosynthesis protein FlhB [Robiginitomaculum sp.]|nr:MAG: flagellar biosynthesis protein FlhB [Robiginitomaculum sp.]
MAEEDSGQEKSLEASEQKLRKAREKGDVVQSTELNTVMMYIGTCLAILMLGGMVSKGVLTLLSSMLEYPERYANGFTRAEGDELRNWFFGSVSMRIMPFFAIPAAFVIVSMFAQQSITFSGSKIKPKLSNLSPVSNAKKKYGPGGLGEFIKSFAKLMVILVIAGFFFYKEYEILPAYVGMSAKLLPGLMAEKMLELMLYVIIGAAAIAAIDYPAKFMRHRIKQRMTLQEARDENKESEGDPHMKAHRRRRAHEIVNTTMLQDVTSASVVIVNPTHYAVALLWDRESGEAPKCVAKGVDHMAFRIRERAKISDVPIYENPPCARALFATTEIGDIIPREHYAAVAAAIHYADTLSKKSA